LVAPTRSTIVPRIRIDGLRRALARVREEGNVVRHPAFLATVAAVLVAGIVLATVLRAGHARALDAGHAKANDLSRLLEEQTLRSLEAVDLVLQGMADAMRTFSIPEHD
jgi:hypothetical protein